MKEIKGGLWRKIAIFFGFDNELESKSQIYGDNKEDASVNLNHQGNSNQILVLDPSSFEEVREIVDYLLNRRPIILNLHKTDKEQAKRIIDFVSGATYALQGNMQKIGDGIFLFTPKDMEISGQEVHSNEFWKENWREDVK